MSDILTIISHNDTYRCQNTTIKIEILVVNERGKAHANAPHTLE